MKRRYLAAMIAAAVLLLGCVRAYAGGPRWHAGASDFSPSVEGQPIVWAGGKINFFLDQGSLSPILNQQQANAIVKAAATVWNAVPTAAMQFTIEGNLSEDVNGTNVTAGANGPTLPSDIRLTGNVLHPVAVIYDEDGSVINDFYGPGTSTPGSCLENSVFLVFGAPTAAANFAHALMLINGLCATNASQLTMLQYQIMRGFGQLIGLDWSQTNEEMFAANQPTTQGLSGWPMMHPIERLCSNNTQSCIPSPTQLRPDDIAALNRMYPVTAANISSFTQKKMITAANTISVQGTIQFKHGQGMQGVNVVLRPMIPNTDLPDIRYTVTAVSGDAFVGNAGNIISGTTDAQGNALNRYGSNDPALEGFFDLSGVPLPAGQTTANYQLSFEAINPLYTGQVSVGPYTTSQVTPSGTMPTIELQQLAAGSSVMETVTIGNSADDSLSGNDGTVAAPASLAASGEWMERISGYGHLSWFQGRMRANRQFTVEAQAVDESGQPSNNKANLVLGAWNGTDAEGTPPDIGTIQPLNGAAPGLTTLQVATVADGQLRIGIADARGDGRPDYLYRGRVLYADSVAPARLPSEGGPMVIYGIGFRPNTVVTVNGVAAAVTSITPTEITAMAPASNGVTGNVAVEVQDPQTLGFAVIGDGLSYSAQSGDGLSIVAAPTGAIAIGVPQPFTVRAMNWDDEWPAGGVPVTFSVTEGAATLGCGQPTCTITTEQNGSATLAISAFTPGLTQVTASLTNGVRVQAEFTGAAPPEISAISPDLYLAIGAQTQWSPQALVLVDGVPDAGMAVSWTTSGAGMSIADASAPTGANGVATEQIAAGPLASGAAVPVNACLPLGAGCAAFHAYAVHVETAQLQPVSGTQQTIAAGQNFAPITLEVMDAVGHPMAGAVVTFYETLHAWTPDCTGQGPCPAAPVLNQTAVQLTSANDGTVTLVPVSGQGEAVRLSVVAAVGSSATLDFEMECHP
jgi:hypothetical protein